MIGIIAALPQELGALTARLSSPKLIVHGADRFEAGELAGVPVIATLSGMGKVNAAITAQRLISEFRVKALLLTGVAGGLDPVLEIGDVLLGRWAFQHDYGFFGEDFVRHPVGVLPELGIGTGEESAAYDLARWPEAGGTKEIFPRLCEALENAQGLLSPVPLPGGSRQPRFRAGTIATGDQFIANEAERKRLGSQGADAVEMEGAAVAQAAARNGVPCLLLRTISDKAGSAAKLDFRAFFAAVGANNARLIEELLRSEALRAYWKAL